MRKNTLVLGLCSIGVLFLSGFQSPVALSRPSQEASDTQVNPCLKSTCRDVPLREHLTAYRSPHKGSRYKVCARYRRRF